MAKVVFVLALLLAVTAVEAASAAPSFCSWVDGMPNCGDDIDFDGPA